MNETKFKILRTISKLTTPVHTYDVLSLENLEQIKLMLINEFFKFKRFEV